MTDYERWYAGYQMGLKVGRSIRKDDAALARAREEIKDLEGELESLYLIAYSRCTDE